MQLTLFRFFLVLIVASICAEQKIGLAMSEEIPYRFLEPPYIDAKSTTINYQVSVDRFLDRLQIEQLICRVLRDHKPISFRELRISIFYKLDEWLFTGGFAPLERKYREHIIAEYWWTMSLSDKRDRLLISRDVKGNLVPAFYEFDHTKSCK
jgi:hypothetical protein